MEGLKVMPKITEGSVEETLFIPLCAKAEETLRKDGIIRDPKSVDILKTANIDASKFYCGNMVHMGIVIRTEILDLAANNFIQEYCNGKIINLGCGLDTRITRVDNGKIHWFDLDLPKVIELRKCFFQESDRIKFISRSIFDFSWIDELEIDKDEPVLIIAEGVFMYQREEMLIKLFKAIVDNIPKAEIYFDVVHNYFVGKSISSTFVWGVSNNSDIKALNENLEVVEQFSIGDYHKKRQGWALRLMNIIPSTRNRSQVYHLRTIRR